MAPTPWRNKWYVIKRYADIHHGLDWGYWAVIFGSSRKDDADSYRAKLGAPDNETMVVAAGALTTTLMLLNG